MTLTANVIRFLVVFYGVKIQLFGFICVFVGGVCETCMILAYLYRDLAYSDHAYIFCV